MSLLSEPKISFRCARVELGEVTRAQRDAEGTASAIELDGDEVVADEAHDSEDEAVGLAVGQLLPLPGWVPASQFELSQDAE